jgi:hypothetical protein
VQPVILVALASAAPIDDVRAAWERFQPMDLSCGPPGTDAKVTMEAAALKDIERAVLTTTPDSAETVEALVIVGEAWEEMGKDLGSACVSPVLPAAEAAARRHEWDDAAASHAATALGMWQQALRMADELGLSSGPLAERARAGIERTQAAARRGRPSAPAVTPLTDLDLDRIDAADRREHMRDATHCVSARARLIEAADALDAVLRTQESCLPADFASDAREAVDVANAALENGSAEVIDAAIAALGEVRARVDRQIAYCHAAR